MTPAELLKLKSLPYGSIHSITNNVLDSEINNIITTVTQAGCLYDTNIHNQFLERFYNWILETKNNKILGLEKFQSKVFTNGSTEAFDKFYLKNKTRRLRYFKGEYMYHAAASKSYFEAAPYLDDSPVNANDVIVISLPFADTGEEHPNMSNVLSRCSELGVPVLIDCCYFGACGNLTMDFNYSCITDITFSLAKCFPLGFMRVGMRLTRNDDNDPLFVYNKNNYVNRLGSAVGLELLNRYTPDYNYNTYRDTQEQFCDQLGVAPSKCVFFATSKDKFPEYNRGTDSNRLCFSKFLKDRKLPI
jgi:hypothetical protein